MNNRLILNEKIILFLKFIKKKECITTIDNIDSIQNKLLLNGRIGTKSKYGHIYTMNSKDKEYKLSIKVISDSLTSTKEIKILEKIKKNLKKTLNIHFPIIYKISYCNYLNTKNVWIHDIRPSSNETNILSFSKSPLSNYSIIFNELAEGDLKSFLHMKHSNTILKNMTIQIIISILSYHNLGFIHLDTHYGNFLYHKIEKKGCFHYKINNKNYYLENNGYIFTIWDFGLSKEINDIEYLKDIRKEKKYKKTILYDYYRILNIIDSYYKNPNIKLLINELKINMLDLNIKYEKILFNYLINNDFFLLSPIGEIQNLKPIILKTNN
jgi:hypothetical protein